MEEKAQLCNISLRWPVLVQSTQCWQDAILVCHVCMRYVIVQINARSANKRTYKELKQDVSICSNELETVFSERLFQKVDLFGNF